MILLTIFFMSSQMCYSVCIVLLEVYADIAERKISQISNIIMAKVDMSTYKIYQTKEPVTVKYLPLATSSEF